MKNKKNSYKKYLSFIEITMSISLLAVIASAMIISFVYILNSYQGYASAKKIENYFKLCWDYSSLIETQIDVQIQQTPQEILLSYTSPAEQILQETIQNPVKIPYWHLHLPNKTQKATIHFLKGRFISEIPYFEITSKKYHKNYFIALGPTPFHISINKNIPESKPKTFTIDPEIIHEIAQKTQALPITD